MGYTGTDLHQALQEFAAWKGYEVKGPTKGLLGKAARCLYNCNIDSIDALDRVQYRGPISRDWRNFDPRSVAGYGKKTISFIVHFMDERRLSMMESCRWAD